MTLQRLLTTAAAVALIACPAIALAADAPAAPSAAPAAPAASTTPAAPADAAPATPALPTIPKIASGADLYETAKASGQFTILIKAIDATNLKAALKSNPNITLFAPTDAAFNALPPDQLAKLMSPDGLTALQHILLYHVVGAQVDTTKIKGAKGPVPTIAGQPLQIDGSNASDLLVNNADIIQADVRTTNGGVLNAIDKVLVPPDSPFAASLSPASAPASAGATPPASAPAGT